MIIIDLIVSATFFQLKFYFVIMETLNIRLLKIFSQKFTDLSNNFKHSVEMTLLSMETKLSFDIRFIFLTFRIL